MSDIPSLYDACYPFFDVLEKFPVYLICKCGGEIFKVMRSASYETSATCIQCGKSGVVHDG